MDKKHFQDAYAQGHGYLAQVGRVRQDRVDTGEHFIDNEHSIHAGCVIRGLLNHKFILVGCHWYRQDYPGKSSKYVVVLALGREGVPVNMPDLGLRQRRELARTCWQWCHGWSNPGGTVTLNFGGRQPDVQPKKAVVVRDGSLTAANIGALVTEEDE